MKYILALDQGTTSSRAILFDEEGTPQGMEQQEFAQIYPQPAWVEHAPEDIWTSQMGVVSKLLRNRKIDAGEIAAIAITNQRETTLLWERDTGRPVANAIVWQDRRTANYCHELREAGYSPLFHQKTGLPIDPYFSGTKIRWLLDNIPELRTRAERGEIAFGTVDSFLMWRLTGGRVHATDVSNASRTMLYNIVDGDWDDDLLDILQIPRCILPDVNPSSHIYGETDSTIFGASIPIAGVAGDQQAATFGQACFKPGGIKNTYGTGSFLLMNTGTTPQFSKHGLLTTVAWNLGEKACSRTNNKSSTVFALEGSVFVTGAAVQWLRDELQIIRKSSEIEPLAQSVPDNGGVYFVPAFVGLGAPHWDAEARGAIFGLTRGTGRAHLARAALEAVCFQTYEVIEAMKADSGIEISGLRVDGGMTVNRLLMQMQADILGIPVIKPVITETTALGAAYLAGLAIGYWPDTETLAQQWKIGAEFTPQISVDQRESMLSGWRRAVARVTTGG